MTTSNKQPRQKWVCDACGKEDYWSDTWGYYGSYALAETCPQDLPCGCSDECMKVVTEKITSGEWELPVLRADAGGFYVTRKRKGY